MSARYLPPSMDQQLLFRINHDWTAPWLDRVMAAASSFDLFWPLLLVAGVAVAIFGGFRGRALLLTIGLAVGLTDGIVVDNLKKIANRPRPHEAVAGVRTLDLGKAKPRFLALTKPLKVKISGEPKAVKQGNSFPSGHASNNFCFAAVCLCFFRRWGWLALLPAALVSYSRIYVGSHWPSDILVSALIGFVIGLLVSLALNAVWRRWGSRIWPEIWRRHPALLVP